MRALIIITIFILIFSPTPIMKAQDGDDCLSPIAINCDLIDPITENGIGNIEDIQIDLPRGLFRFDFSMTNASDDPTSFQLILHHDNTPLYIHSLRSIDDIEGTAFQKVISDSSFLIEVIVEESNSWQFTITQIDPLAVSHDTTLLSIQDVEALGPVSIDEGVFEFRVDYANDNSMVNSGFVTIQVNVIRVDGNEEVGTQTEILLGDWHYDFRFELQGGIYCITVMTEAAAAWHISILPITSESVDKIT